MRKPTKKILNFFVVFILINTLLLSVSKLNAQQYLFEEVGAVYGVNVPLVNKTFHDENGHFWLATMGDGVLWWNGNQFVKPYSENVLDNDFVLDIGLYCGKLYILTEKSLVVYDGHHYHSTDLPAERFLRMRANGDNIYLLSQRSGLWIVNDSGIVSLQAETKDVRFYDFQFLGSDILSGTSAGLWLMDSLCRLKHTWIEDVAVRTVCIGESDRILAGTHNGLVALSIQNDSVYQIISGHEVRSITRQNDIYWVGTDGGGIWTGRLNTPGKWITRANGLVNQRIRSLEFDCAGRLWITTADGMAMMPGKDHQIHTHPDGNNQFYRGLLAKDQSWWVSRNAGISRYSLGVWTEIVDLPPGVVFSILEDSKGRIILGGENGLMVLSSDGVLLTHWKHELPDPFITAMTFHRGKLYLGCASGVYEVSDYLNNPKFKSVIPIGVSHLVNFKDTLYALTYSKGIAVFTGGELHRYITEFGDEDVFSILPSALAISEDGTMWLGTSNKGGFVGNEGNWQNFTANGATAIYDWYALGNNRMLAVTEDDAIIFFRNKELQARRFPYVQRFPLGYKKRSFPFGYRDNVLYLTTTEGIVQLGLSVFEGVESVTPEVYRIDLYFDAHTQWREKADALRFASGVPERLELQHRENYLRFVFGALGLPLVSRYLEYRYRMNQLDPKWIDAGSLSEAVYTNIEPGRYTFEVQSRWPGGEWASTDRVELHIIPPWYRTFWFYALLVFALISITVFVVRYRSRQISEKMRLENAVLANERIALRLQMNPHFLFNALESIGNFVLKNDAKSTMKYLNSFTKLMRLTLEAGTDKDHPVESEIMLLRSYVELEQLRFNHIFEVFIEVDEEIDYDIAIPPMLIQPHVENAILHGLRNLEDRKGALYIRFKLAGDRLVVEIEDNGVGREYNRNLPKRKSHRSMALEINRKRIELLSKSFDRAFSLEIVDLYNDEKTPMGTKVIISLPIIYLDEL